MDHNDAYFVSGQRQGSRIIHADDGLHYYVDYTRNDGETVYLKCILGYRQHCRGRAIYTREHGLYVTMQHNHTRDPLLPLVRRLRQNVLQRCRAVGHTSYRQILREERRRFPRSVQARVTIGMRNSMRNARMHRYPNIPATLDGLGRLLQNPLYSSISMTVDGEDNMFASYIEATDGTKCIIFVSNRTLQFMERVSTIFSDGTFSTPALPRVSQIFNIVTVWNWHIIPLVHCLMERRTESAYQAIFQQLKRLSPNFRPRVTMSDYEIGLIKALRTEFPEAWSDGCLFHFIAAIIKHAKNELGMVIIIRENPVVRRIIQLCSSIPLAPPHMMRAAMRAIAAEASATLYFVMLIPFFDYLWHTWLSGPRYESLSVCGCDFRTNNACESLHRLISSELGPHHPNIYRVIECFSNLEDTAQTDIETLFLAHNPGRPRRTSSLANDARIKLWTQNLLNNMITIGEFVHYVSPSIHGVFEQQLNVALNGRQQ